MRFGLSDAVTIPTVDLSDGMAAHALDDACRRYGFFYLRGHGVSTTVTAKAFDASKQFFAEPPHKKAAYHIRHSHPHQRGYVPLYEESLDEGVAPDFKESFDMGVDHAPDHPDVMAGRPFAAPNVWPPVPGFREAVEAYHTEMMRLGRDLVRLGAVALGLSERYFDAAMTDPVGNLRLLHYPPSANDAERKGCGAHTDYGFLTILAQDRVGGLEIEADDGRWLAIQPQAETFVVNLGDLLTHWTGGLYKARRHRVVSADSSDRYSIPFFFDPDVDATVDVVPTCRHVPGAAAYLPINAGDFLQGRFDATFTYRK